MTNSLKFGVSIILISASFSCEISTTPGTRGNNMPVKNNLPPTSISLVSSADTVSFWEKVNLTCLVEDPENDPLSYEWISYRITDNSTLENYEIIKIAHWLNRGEFMSAGKDAVWNPGKIEGKYLIVCNVQDKAGYEISTQKIVNVIAIECASMLTAKCTYDFSDFDTSRIDPRDHHLNLFFIVKNSLSQKVNLYGCGWLVTPGVHIKMNDQWLVYLDPNGCKGLNSGFEDAEHIDFVRVEVFAGEEVQDSSGWSGLCWRSFEKGRYRLFMPYSVGPFYGFFTDTLYSNEFELID